MTGTATTWHSAIYDCSPEHTHQEDTSKAHFMMEGSVPVCCSTCRWSRKQLLRRLLLPPGPMHVLFSCRIYPSTRTRAGSVLSCELWHQRYSGKATDPVDRRPPTLFLPQTQVMQRALCFTIAVARQLCGKTQHMQHACKGRGCMCGQRSLPPPCQNAQVQRSVECKVPPLVPIVAEQQQEWLSARERAPGRYWTTQA